jgi:hypothetical protein
VRDEVDVVLRARFRRLVRAAASPLSPLLPPHPVRTNKMQVSVLTMCQYTPQGVVIISCLFLSLAVMLA